MNLVKNLKKNMEDNYVFIITQHGTKEIIFKYSL